MRGRNTLGDHWKPNRGAPNSVQRKTVTANHQNFLQSQNRHNTNKTNEQMAKTITETLIKLPNQIKRSSISTSLKPNQKTLFSTIATFLHSIDRQFDQSSMDFDVIMQVLSFFGYPHNYSKTVFQPVGAPHTWHSCLQMMEFLAEIANYYFEYRMHLSEMQEEGELADLIFKSFQKQDDSLLEEYYQRQYQQLKKEEEYLLYQIQSSELTLKNIKNSQRSLSDLTEEENNLQQKLDRQTQNVIEIDQTNTSIINQLQKAEDQLQELSLEHNRLINKINILEQEINNQQLNIDEANRIQLEIKTYHAKIKELKEDQEKRRAIFENQKKQLLEKYFEFESDLNQICSSVSKYEAQMNARNIEVVQPSSNCQLFMEALAEEDLAALKEKLEMCIETEKINKMLNQQKNFYTLLEIEKKRLIQETEQKVGKKASYEGELTSLSKELEQLYLVDRQNQQQYEYATKQTLRLQDEQIQLISQNGLIQQRINATIQKQKILNEEVKIRKQKLRENLSKVKVFQRESQKAVVQIDNKIEQTKRQIEERLERIHSEFSQLSAQIESAQNNQ